MTCKPIVKWAGGKTKLLPELHKRMPRTFGRYFEPFAGGAALFFYLDLKCPAYLSDANADLIAMYRTVRDDVDGVIRWLRNMAEHHAKAHANGMADTYYAGVRSRWNMTETDKWEPTAHAAAFIYLNKTCFNGLWRVNGKGEFNVPMGDYKSPKICDEDALRAASVKLRGEDGPGQCVLTVCGYEGAASMAASKHGSFVYFDPPYDPASPTSSFTSYVGAFGKDEQRKLARMARSLVSHGVQVMLSNSDTPFIRDLYAWARIDTVQCPRAINSKGDKRGAVNELIITGGYDP